MCIYAYVALVRVRVGLYIIACKVQVKQAASVVDGAEDSQTVSKSDAECTVRPPLIGAKEFAEGVNSRKKSEKSGSYERRTSAKKCSKSKHLLHFFAKIRRKSVSKLTLDCYFFGCYDYLIVHDYISITKGSKMTLDLVGKRFGRLVVVGKEKTGWVASCDCTKLVTGLVTADLTGGRRKSCGCINKGIGALPGYNRASLIIRRRLEMGKQRVTDQIIEFAEQDVSKGKHLLLRWAFTREKQIETPEYLPEPPASFSEPDDFTDDGGFA